METNLANRLLDAIENLYLENLVLKVVLRDRGWKAMDKVLAETKADRQITARVRKVFAPVREKIAQDSELEQVIQEFLQVVPAKKDVN